MTPEQFVYWLNGYMEMADPKTMGPAETKMLKEHLNLVLKKVTPEKKEIEYPITDTSIRLC